METTNIPEGINEEWDTAYNSGDEATLARLRKQLGIL